MIFKLRYAECAQESRSVLGYARVCAGMCGCVRRVCADVHICAGVRGCVGVCTSMHWCVQKCLGVCECVWDEFSEYLLENRVPTSADFNMYPIQIFSFSMYLIIIEHSLKEIIGTLSSVK